ncbi:hypothetical protein DSECCO2_651280 [anaerobic digester metagenome]
MLFGALPGVLVVLGDAGLHFELGHLEALVLEGLLDLGRLLVEHGRGVGLVRRDDGADFLVLDGQGDAQLAEVFRRQLQGELLGVLADVAQDAGLDLARHAGGHGGVERLARSLAGRLAVHGVHGGHGRRGLSASAVRRCARDRSRALVHANFSRQFGPGAFLPRLLGEAARRAALLSILAILSDILAGGVVLGGKPRRLAGDLVARALARMPRFGGLPGRRRGVLALPGKPCLFGGHGPGPAMQFRRGAALGRNGGLGCNALALLGRVGKHIDALTGCRRGFALLRARFLAHGHGLGGLAGHVVVVQVRVELARFAQPGLVHDLGGGLAERGHGLVFLVELGEQFLFHQAERRGQALAGKPGGGARIVKKRGQARLGLVGEVHGPAQGLHFARTEAHRGVRAMFRDLGVYGRKHGLGVAGCQGIDHLLGLLGGEAELAEKAQQLDGVVVGNFLLGGLLGLGNLLFHGLHHLAPGHARFAVHLGFHGGQFVVGETLVLEVVAQGGKIFPRHAQVHEVVVAVGGNRILPCRPRFRLRRARFRRRRGEAAGRCRVRHGRAGVRGCAGPGVIEQACEHRGLAAGQRGVQASAIDGRGIACGDEGKNLHTGPPDARNSSRAVPNDETAILRRVSENCCQNAGSFFPP